MYMYMFMSEKTVEITLLIFAFSPPHMMLSGCEIFRDWKCVKLRTTCISSTANLETVHVVCHSALKKSKNFMGRLKLSHLCTLYSNG